MNPTPIIYIAFNRPDVVARTFPMICAQKPSVLYLIADGPRTNRSGEDLLCMQTRRLIESMITWPCKIIKDYSDVNMGCGKRISSGLTRAFAELGEAIVLEDDILPHPDFFNFCSQQLSTHRDNSSIHSISGFNPLNVYAGSGNAPVPTLFNWIWGWASWQRSWKDYHFDISSTWNSNQCKADIREYIHNDLNFHWHAENFDNLLLNHIDTWDFQWTFTMLEQRRRSLVSPINLIENLGFDSKATHTNTAPAFAQGLVAAPLRIKGSYEDIGLTHDRMHDKLFGLLLRTDSIKRTKILRLMARFPLVPRLSLSY